MLAGGLALALAAAGRRPQLLELDLDRGDIAGSWGVPCDRTVADLLPVIGEIGPNHVRHARHDHASGVGLLLAPGRPGAARGWDGGAVDRLLEAIGSEGDLVVDGGSGLTGPAAAAAARAGATLLVTPPTLTGARRALRLAEALAESGARAPHLVVNRGTGRAELGPAAVGVAIGMPVAAILPVADREAPELSSGRRPRPRRGGLVEVLDALAQSALVQAA
jgi:pilus assembly protein CpaE